MIKNRLKVILAEKGKRNNDLVEHLDTSPQLVSMWVRNASQPNAINLEKICKFLGIQASEFYDKK